MNIFVLDRRPGVAAVYHNDSHVVKMILESAQLLCGVHHMTGGTAPYRLTHKNHPCSIWARQSLSNYRWLSRLFYALHEEWIYRRGCEGVHAAVQKLVGLPEPHLNDIGLTPFHQAMDEQYKHADAVEAYRHYYICAKRGYYVKDKWKPSTWKRRGAPYWYPLD